MRANRRLRGLGLAVDFTGTDAAGRTWYFDVAGPNSAYRGGMARSETVWRALGRAHVMAATDHAPFVVLTTQLPRAGTEADRALRAPGPGGIFDAVDLLSPAARKRLGRLRRRALRLAPRRVLVGRRRGAGRRLTVAADVGTVVACAVVRDDPPRVFVAEDLETLNWVLACQLVATTPGRELPPGERAALRQALREERWGDAVFAFIARTGTAVDVYESTELHAASGGRRGTPGAAAHPPLRRLGAPG